MMERDDPEEGCHDFSPLQFFEIFCIFLYINFFFLFLGGGFTERMNG